VRVERRLVEIDEERDCNEIVVIIVNISGVRRTKEQEM